MAFVQRKANVPRRAARSVENLARTGRNARAEPTPQTRLTEIISHTRAV
jgi:hypothetical protein